MENKIIIGNMKMYINLNDINSYLDYTKNKIPNNVILCPSCIYIPYFLNNNFNLGIQNIYYEEGAYTGEISASQAYEMGVRYALIGHVERRVYFNEDDALINKKVKSGIKNKLKVILFIGEIEENNLEKEKIIKQQLQIGLKDVDKSNYENIIIAYEPRWAIGTNKTPSNIEIENMINYIKSILDNSNIKVVYGGSINENNINELIKIKNIDGFLIGKSCINPEKFLKIISIINNKTNI